MDRIRPDGTVEKVLLLTSLYSLDSGDPEERAEGGNPEASPS